MFDSNSDLTKFHDAHVTLSATDRTEMKDRRNANRDRLSGRIKEKSGLKPPTYIKQGSYAMRTMVQDSDNDYDIDDGLYFPESDLKKPDGEAMSPKELRDIVKNALADNRFTTPPKAKKTCVRVFYNEGYHVDMPCYRVRTADQEYELALDDKWVVSRAADVEKWFNDFNVDASPDLDNGRQFRRLVRLIKKFSRSRKEWKDKIAPGFTITALAKERYVGIEARDDQVFRETVKKVADRLAVNKIVKHPTTAGANLNKGSDDPKIEFLRQKFAWAADELAGLDANDCDQEKARKIWSKVFNTTFFNDLPQNAKSGATSNSVSPVTKEGGGRYA